MIMLDYISHAIGFMLLLMLMCFLIAGVIILIMTIAMWKILDKADQPGWAVFIPIYGPYLMCKISGVNPWWLAILLCSPILFAFPIIGHLACLAVCVYFMILFSVSLSRSFGKEDSFAAGLIFLAPIFYLILAFDNASYVGPKPMDDIIFKNQNNNNGNSNNINEDNKFCTNCGAKLTASTNFCPYCGKDCK